VRACYYVATSVDGLIADANGSVDWLNPFFDTDYGYHDFLNSVDTVVMGRRTYDRILKSSKVNPYSGKRFIVLSHSRAIGPHADLFWPGPLFDLTPRLAAMGTRSLWIVGGGSVAGSFLDAGLIDEVHQFVMPVALGCGTPIFGPLRQPASLQLKESRSFPNGVVQMRYVTGR
ncbi:MAG: dihydrofolate reductase family protein, partial [Acidobacteriota bacterium]